MSIPIIVVSDMHIGSTLGLCTPKVILDNEGEYCFTKDQKWLWRSWCDFWSKFVPETIGEKTEYDIVLNGDLLDNFHHQETALFSSNTADQVRCAYDVLTDDQVVRKMRHVYVIRGTEAHAGKAGQLEEKLSKLINARSLNGIKSTWSRTLSLGEHDVHFAHHIGVTFSPLSISAAPCRELISSCLACSGAGRKVPSLLVRSHRHMYSQLSIGWGNREVGIVCTPGWQLATAYVSKHSPSHKADIGGVVLLPGKEKPRVEMKRYVTC